MRVERVDDGSYAVMGITGDELVTLGVLADFPVWSAQPRQVERTCAALHNAITSAGTADFTPTAEGAGMVASTTV